MNTNQIIEIFCKHNLFLGRLISWSKTAYREMNPNNFVVFNANIVVPSKGKIWYGDLDITKDSDTLKKISEEINEPIYVLKEMDARFENENDEIDELVKRAVWSTNS